jgi:hypothetical protein
VTERGDTPDDTRRAPDSGSPEVSQSAGARAIAEGAAEAVDPAPAAIGTPAPPVDESAATPDRPGPTDAVAGTIDERPELLVAGAFVGGLAVALILKRVAGG